MLIAALLCNKGRETFTFKFTLSNMDDSAVFVFLSATNVLRACVCGDDGMGVEEGVRQVVGGGCNARMVWV